MSGGFVERELAVARGLASCRGDDARLDEADAEIAKLRAENDALRVEIEDLYRWLASKAHKNTAYDRSVPVAYWSIGFFSDDSRHSLAAAIEDAMEKK